MAVEREVMSAEVRDAMGPRGAAAMGLVLRRKGTWAMGAWDAVAMGLDGAVAMGM